MAVGREVRERTGREKTEGENAARGEAVGKGRGRQGKQRGIRRKKLTRTPGHCRHPTKAGSTRPRPATLPADRAHAHILHACTIHAHAH